MFLPGKTEAIAATFAVAITGGWWHLDQIAKDQAPVDDWFTVLKIAVPTMEVGENPVVIYDYQVKQPATVTRVVEIVPSDDPDSDPVCTGRDVKKFEKENPEPDIALRLSAFIGTGVGCHLPQGTYIPKVSLFVRADGYPTKKLRRVGDPFDVTVKDVVPFTVQDKEQLAKAQELLDDPIPLVPVLPQ